MSNPLIQFNLAGQWAQARQWLGTVSRGELQRAANTAIRLEAEGWAEEMREGINKQAPGGTHFLPLTPLTIAFKKSPKVLIRKRRLINAIRHHRIRYMEYFVGVNHPTQARIARAHEFGTTTTQVLTLKQVNWFFATLSEIQGPSRQQKMMRRLLSAHAQGGRYGVATPFYTPGATFVVTIRARPFMQPVADRRKPGFERRIGGAIMVILMQKRGLLPKGPVTLGP